MNQKLKKIFPFFLLVGGLFLGLVVFRSTIGKEFYQEEFKECLNTAPQFCEIEDRNSKEVYISCAPVEVNWSSREMLNEDENIPIPKSILEKEFERYSGTKKEKLRKMVDRAEEVYENTDYVCHDISWYFFELARSNGVETFVVNGRSHVFNLVRLDGEFRIIDITGWHPKYMYFPDHIYKKTEGGFNHYECN